MPDDLALQPAQQANPQPPGPIPPNVDTGALPERPLGITVLAILNGLLGVSTFMVFVFFGAGVGLGYMHLTQTSTVQALILVIIASLIFLVRVVLPCAVSYGFWYGKKWAWWIEIVIVSLLVIPSILSLLALNVSALMTTIFGILIIYYLNMDGVKAFFDSEKNPPAPSMSKNKPIFIIVTISIILIGGLLISRFPNVANAGISKASISNASIPNVGISNASTTTIGAPAYRYELTSNQIHGILGNNFTSSDTTESLNQSMLRTFRVNQTTAKIDNVSFVAYKSGSVILENQGETVEVSWAELENVSDAKAYLKYPNSTTISKFGSVSEGSGTEGNASFVYSNISTTGEGVLDVSAYDGPYAISIFESGKLVLTISQVKALLAGQLLDLGIS